MIRKWLYIFSLYILQYNLSNYKAGVRKKWVFLKHSKSNRTKKSDRYFGEFEANGSRGRNRIRFYQKMKLLEFTEFFFHLKYRRLGGTTRAAARQLSPSSFFLLFGSFSYYLFVGRSFFFSIYFHSSSSLPPGSVLVSVRVWVVDFFFLSLSLSLFQFVSFVSCGFFFKYILFLLPPAPSLLFFFSTIDLISQQVRREGGAFIPISFFFFFFFFFGPQPFSVASESTGIHRWSSFIFWFVCLFVFSLFFLLLSTLNWNWRRQSGGTGGAFRSTQTR